MAVLLQIPFLARLPLLRGKRLVAVDAGSHSLKVLLVEQIFGRLRVLRAENISLREEGLISHEDLGRHLQTVLKEWDHYQAALALPQHISLSQVIDLPTENPDQVKQRIEEESAKLSGLSERTFIYDYVPLKPFDRFQNPYWITLCQEGEVLAQIDRLQLATEDLCEVTTAANALVASYRMAAQEVANSILVDIGSSSTTVAVVLEGEQIYANTFSSGADKLTQIIVSKRGLTLEEAESLKHSENLLDGRSAIPELQTAVQSWAQELDRLLLEWLNEHSKLLPLLANTPIVLSGGASLQPGLLDFLNRSKRRFIPWPSPGDASKFPDPQFAIAYGVAIQAFDRSKKSISLLPKEYQESWQKQRLLQRIQSANFVIILFLAFVLAIGTWNKVSLISRKNKTIAEAQTALREVAMTETLLKQVAVHYESVRPVLERQQQTLDALKCLSTIQEVRGTQSFWYVLLADQQSYFSAPSAATTNSAAATNGNIVIQTNRFSPKYGFIAELCLPADGSVLGTAVSQIITNLKQPSLFRHVDIVPVEQRKNLVDAKLLVPNRTVALTLELPENEFQAPPDMRNALLPATGRENRNSPRTFKQKLERSTSPYE